MLLYHSIKPDLLHKWSLLQGSIPESFGKKRIKIDKVIQRLLRVTTPTKYKNVENFVNFEFIFMKLLGIDPCRKRNTILRLACLATFLWAVANLM